MIHTLILSRAFELQFPTRSTSLCVFRLFLLHGWENTGEE
jgi:hypothetical protein